MDRITSFLTRRENEQLTRSLKPVTARANSRILCGRKEFIDFSSNDYLGLANHPRLKTAACDVIKKLGAGASASRLLSGDFTIHHDLEEKTARFKNKESALVFNSGYQANVGIISALCRPGDVVFSDRLNHASIIDGIKLSGAKLLRFDHNDSVHLAKLLARERARYQEALIITETVFSMDGDLAPLEEIVELKEKCNCRIMVDEAHATGVFGKDGGGVVEEKGLAEKIDLIMGTFSKALGSFGAYVACSEVMKDYLVNSCRSFIYSTALPPGVIAANLASLELVEQEPFRRHRLLENAQYFRDSLKQLGLPVGGESQIVPLLVGGNDLAVKLSRSLQERGHRVFPIRPPTVPPRQARVRFSLTYDHSKETLRRLVKDIEEISCF